jgi:hypothetical protein
VRDRLSPTSSQLFSPERVTVGAFMVEGIDEIEDIR